MCTVKSTLKVQLFGNLHHFENIFILIRLHFLRVFHSNVHVIALSLARYLLVIATGYRLRFG